MNKFLVWVCSISLCFSNTISFPLKNAPESLDPALTADEYTFIVTSNIYEPLIRSSQEGKLEPGLAKSWEQKGRSIIFHLRDAYWENGDPITAKDILYSFKRVLDPETGSRYSHLAYDIEGAEKFANGSITFENVGIKALNQKTISITFKNYSANLAESALPPLTFTAFVPVHKDDYKIASGPFKIELYDHQNKIVLKRNKRYFKEINVEKMNMFIVRNDFTAISMYRNGEFNFIPTLQRKYLTPDLIKDVKSFNRNEIHFISFNFNSPLKDINLRRAISLVIDREELCAKILEGDGHPARSIVPEGFPAIWDQQPFAKENIDLAKESYNLFLKSEEKPSLRLLCDVEERSLKVAQYIQEQVSRKLGFDLEILALPHSVKISHELAGDFDISLSSWIADYFGPPFTFFEILHSKSQNNRSKWHSAEFDNLYELASTSENLREKTRYLKRSEEILNNTLPIVPIYSSISIFLSKPELEGIKRGTASTNPDFRDVKFINR